MKGMTLKNKTVSIRSMRFYFLYPKHQICSPKHGNSLPMSLVFCFLFGATAAARGSPKPDTAFKKSEALAQVGVQGTSVITTREVLLSAFIERWFLVENIANKKQPKNPPKNPLLEGPPDVTSDGFKKQLNSNMLEALVEAESDQFDVAKVDEDLLKTRTAAILPAIRGSPLWSPSQAQEKEILKLLRRKMRAQKYFQLMSEKALTTPSESEIKEYFDKNRIRFGNRPIAEFRENIVDFLTQRKQEEKLRNHFEALKKKHRLRVLTEPSV